MKSKPISWSAAIGFLGIASWLIGNWLQLSDRSILLFTYWQWWLQAVFLELVAISLKLNEHYRSKAVK